MRFMMLMYPGPRAEAPGAMPSAEEIGAMMKFNEELSKSGALLALDGLQPSEKGARVSFKDGTPTVTDGPFAETKELLGGYWMIQVASKAEAVEWARRCPANPADVIEIRQVFEMSDFGPDIEAKEAESVKVVEEGMAANAKR
jgi:hypothetical protein